MATPSLQELLENDPKALVRAVVHEDKADPSVQGRIVLRLTRDRSEEGVEVIRAFLENGDELSLEDLFDLLPLVDDEFAENPALPKVFIYSEYAKFDWLLHVAKKRGHRPAVKWLRRAGAECIDEVARRWASKAYADKGYRFYL